MSTVFEILYEVAIEIQTRPKLKRLTAHHNTDRAVVEPILRRSILQLLMPEEGVESPWKKTRIFLRNYVNRSQPPVTSGQMLAFLNDFERHYNEEEQRIAALAEQIKSTLRGPKVGELIEAVQKITSNEPLAALGNLTYLQWIDARWLRWVNEEVADLNVEELLHDIRVLSADKPTKIVGMGLPLTANFFADMGLSVFAKPDLHVKPIINILTLESGETEAFRGIVRIAREEAPRLASNRRFAWLREAGGLQPRFLDRLIYLIGSDNFALDGVKCRRWAPERRQLMRDALISSGMVSARYSA